MATQIDQTDQSSARQETIDAFVEQRVDGTDVQLRTKALLAMADDDDDHTVMLRELEGERALLVSSPSPSEYVSLIDGDADIELHEVRSEKRSNGRRHQYLGTL